MAIQDQKADNSNADLGSRAVALAEQLGRLAGTLEGKAEAWADRAALADQLTKVRDGASDLLKNLSSNLPNIPGIGSRAERGRAGAQTGQRASSMADPAHAPGKRHRKPAPNKRGAKKSDERIPKMKTAQAARKRRKSYA